jgi:hypothetical protein
MCPALPSRNVNAAASVAQQWPLSATFECVMRVYSGEDEARVAFLRAIEVCCEMLLLLLLQQLRVIAILPIIAGLLLAQWHPYAIRCLSPDACTCASCAGTVCLMRWGWRLVVKGASATMHGLILLQM